MDVTKTLVHSLISSRLDYWDLALAGQPDKEINKLQCIENAMASLTSHCKKYDRITPILDSFHWLSVRQRIAFKVLVLTFKALHDLASKYIKSLTVPYVPKHNIHPFTMPTLTESKFQTKWYRASVYNSLPLDLGHAKSLDMFKAKLKTYLFNQAFY